MTAPDLAIPDVLGYYNAVELADLVNEALTEWEVGHRTGRHPADLDAPVLRLVSSTPRIMGQTGRIVERRSVEGSRSPMFVVAFTVRQATAMGELLAEALPELAARAAAAQEAAQA